ncbi:hypothetical protein D3C75_755090 [compost metagenome]
MLVVGGAAPVLLAHQVVDGEYLVGRLVDERGAGVRIGQVGDLALALDVARDDHQTGIRLVGDTQDQGHVVGGKQVAQLLHGDVPLATVHGRVVQGCYQTVVFGQIQARQGMDTCSCLFHPITSCEAGSLADPLLFLSIRQVAPDNQGPADSTCRAITLPPVLRTQNLAQRFPATFLPENLVPDSFQQSRGRFNRNWSNTPTPVADLARDAVTYTPTAASRRLPSAAAAASSVSVLLALRAATRGRP